jgi:Ca2+-binding EF-hand superfamily protein
MDEDGDGVLSKSELTKGINIFKKKFGDFEGVSDIDDLIKKIDMDGNGNIDIAEFITASLSI